MNPLSVMALFCEDIREEKGETTTLVGIMPDNVNVNNLRQGPETDLDRIISKLCIYTRINFDPTFDLGSPVIRLVLPDDEIIDLGAAGAELVKKSKTEAVEKGNILAGIILKATVWGFRPLPGPTRIEVEINGKKYVAGSLTFRPKQPAD